MDQWSPWLTMTFCMNANQLKRSYTEEGSLLITVRLAAADSAIKLMDAAEPVVLQARGPQRAPRWGWVRRKVAVLWSSHIPFSL